AMPGSRSRHNSAYWSGVPYVGVGPSAHSFDGISRQWNVSAYAEWARRLTGNEGVTAGEEVLSGENRAAERVYLGLRTENGLTVKGRDLGSARTWVDHGWAVLHDSVVRLTPEGWLRLDSLAAGLTGI
nr:coproporphyrinogen III oxidase [Gemmatimonadaceae bacterium]